MKKCTLFVLCIGICTLIACTGCSLFNSFTNTSISILGNALETAINEGFETQYESAGTKLSTDTSKSLKSTETGLSISVGVPTTSYTSVRKWDNTTDTWGENVGAPPQTDDISAPGLWEIKMSIKTTIRVEFSNYQVSGWTFNGSATEVFDAVLTYELDIEGNVDGQATSTLLNALTDITINGSVQAQGEQSDTIELQAMKFNVAAYKDQDTFCEFKSGSALLGSDDITEELAEYFEDEMF